MQKVEQNQQSKKRYQESSDEEQKSCTYHQTNKFDNKSSQTVINIPGTISKQIYKNNIILPSPYAKQYSNNFVKGKAILHYRLYSKNYLLYDISLLSSVKQPLQYDIRIKYASKNYRIIHYEVKIAYFSVLVKIINLVSSDSLVMNFQKYINKGVYGTVYKFSFMNQNAAVKEIPLDQNPLTKIQLAVKQYAMMKLMAALECGPTLYRIFGFDMVVTQKFVYFSSEECIAFNNYASSLLNQVEFNYKFEQLQMSMLLMHSINICHNDVKPPNIMYSPSKNKLVFIDFGFTEAKLQNPGFMNIQKAKGSLYYCSQQMKQLFISIKNQGYVDTYYNDYIGLKKTKQGYISLCAYDYTSQQNLQNLQNFSYCQNIKCQLQKDQLRTKQKNNLFNSQADVQILFAVFYISQDKLSQLQSLFQSTPELLLKLQVDFQKYYWIFLQMEQSPTLQTVYYNFKDLLIRHSSLSYKTKTIIQNILDPYFKSQIKKNTPKSQLQICMGQIQKNKKSLKRIYQRFQNSQIPANVCSYCYIKQYRQLGLKIPKRTEQNLNIIQKEQNVSEQIKVYRLQSLTKQQNQLILNRFMNLSGNSLLTILTQINQLFKSNDNFIQNIDLNEQFLKSIFHKIFIKVQISHSKEIDRKIKLLNFIQLIMDLCISIIKNFNVQTHILYIAFLVKNGQLETVKFIHSLFPFEIKISSNYQQQISLNHQQQISSNHQQTIFFKDQETHQNQNNILDNLKRYDSLSFQVFQYSLITFSQVNKTYILYQSYQLTLKKTDQMIFATNQKLENILQCQLAFHRKVYLQQIWHILNLILQKCAQAINQMGLQAFFYTQIHHDFKKMINYFDIIFYHHKTKNKNKNHYIISMVKNIQRTHPVFTISRSFCSMIIYNCIMPKSLSEKYCFIQKIKKFIQILTKKQFLGNDQRIYRIKKNMYMMLFRQYLDQHCLLQCVGQLQHLFVQKNKLQFGQLLKIVKNVFKNLNNNAKTKQIQNRILNINQKGQGLRICQKILFEYQPYEDDNKIQKDNKIQQNLKNIGEQTVQRNCVLIKNQYNKKDLIQNKLKQKMLQDFNNIITNPEYQFNFKTKFYYMGRKFWNSVNQYPLQDINLHQYILLFQKQLKKYQICIEQKLKLLKTVKTSCQTFWYFSIIIKSDQFKQKKFTNFSQQNQQNYQQFEENNFQNSKPFITRKIQQFTQQHNSYKIKNENQFWLEIQRQFILQARNQVFNLVIESHRKIKQKQIFQFIWKSNLQFIERQQVKSIRFKRQSSQKYLRWLFLITQLKHLQFSQKDPQKAQTILRELQQISKKYLDVLKPNNYQIKTQSFYLKLLLSAYQQTLKPIGYSKSIIVSRLIDYFSCLIRLNQIFQLFSSEQVYSNFIAFLIEKGLQQIYDSVVQLNSHPQSLQNKQVQKLKNQQENKQILNQINLSTTIKIEELIIYKMFFQMGKIYQKFPCSNYTNIFLKINSFFITKIEKVVQNQSKMTNFNLYQKYQTGYKLINILAIKILFNLIHQRKIHCLSLPYTMMIDNFSFISKREQFQHFSISNREQNLSNKTIQIQSRQKYFNPTNLFVYEKSLLAKICSQKLLCLQSTAHKHIKKLFYSIQLRNLTLKNIQLKTTSETTPDIRKINYLHLKLFRMCTSNQKKLDFDLKSYKTTIQKRKQYPQSQQILRIFIKAFKKQIFDPLLNSFYKDTLNLTKIKTKIIQRLILTLDNT